MGHKGQQDVEKKAAASKEKRPLSTGEGRRTRTFNQRIKSAVAAERKLSKSHSKLRSVK